MHFCEDPISYNMVQFFQFVIRMFGTILMSTRIGPGFRSRVPGLGLSFYSFPQNRKYKISYLHISHHDNVAQSIIIDVFLEKVIISFIVNRKYIL